jgi:hypothetical protein
MPRVMRLLRWQASMFHNVENGGEVTSHHWYVFVSCADCNQHAFLGRFLVFAAKLFLDQLVRQDVCLKLFSSGPISPGPISRK